MNKRIIAACVLLLAVVLVSGCTQQAQVKVSDGSGTDPVTSSHTQAPINSSAGLGAAIGNMNSFDSNMPDTALDEISSGANEVLGLI